jgi:hypothetical protein
MSENRGLGSVLFLYLFLAAPLSLRDYGDIRLHRIPSIASVVNAR